MISVQLVRFKWLERLPWVYFHHASLVITYHKVLPGREIEATPMHGVYSHEWIHPKHRGGTNQGPFGSFQVTDWALLKPKDPINEDMLIGYATGQTGKAYAWHWVFYLLVDVLRRQLPERVWQAPPFQVCTSLVADCFEYAQYPVVEIGKRLVLPDDFLESDKLRVVDEAP